MDEFVLDVRDKCEITRLGTLQNAVNIPLDELRDHLDELPRDRKILVYCQKGQRGYLAACVLKGYGFENVVNLRGGFAQAQLHGFAVCSSAESGESQLDQQLIGCISK